MVLSLLSSGSRTIFFKSDEMIATDFVMAIENKIGLFRIPPIRARSSVIYLPLSMHDLNPRNFLMR